MVRESFVTIMVILTFAPGMAAPVASATLPTIEPKTTCALAVWLDSATRQMRAKTPKNGSRRLQFVMESPSADVALQGHEPGSTASRPMALYIHRPPVGDFFLQEFTSRPAGRSPETGQLYR